MTVLAKGFFLPLGNVSWRMQKMLVVEVPRVCSPYSDPTTFGKGTFRASSKSPTQRGFSALRLGYSPRSPSFGDLELVLIRVSRVE